LIDERLAVHLDTMRQGAQDAIAFVHGMSQEQFLTDQKTQAAVMMAFIRIGESATSIEKRFLTSSTLTPTGHGCRCGLCGTEASMVTTASTSLSFGTPAIIATGPA
jgi:hypothetical protein